MFASNAPQDYICPICLGVKREESDATLMKPTDIVYSDDVVTAFINSFFIGKNPGHVIVVPNVHYENIYDMPNDVGHHIFDVAKRLSGVIKKAYGADGITIKQNNEPAGGQHAFHYHMHLFPRYNNDEFNDLLPEQKRLAEPGERAEYAEKLKVLIHED